VTGPARVGRPQLAQQARDLTAAAVALLKPRLPDGAAEVERVRAAAAGVPGVVVVGETKRGKSSLVNALL
jgi:tRNA U34 5-carboxymethylaminomethyl modifying GTPase MnmE/TrmE